MNDSIKWILTGLIFGLTLYLGFYLISGDVYGRTDYGDKAFHLQRITSPADDFRVSYYAPLLHLMLYPFTWFLPVNLVVSLAMPILIFGLCPLAYVFMCSIFYKRYDSDYFFLYFFCSCLTTFMVTTATWSQALNLIFVFILMGLLLAYEYIESKWKYPTILGVVALGLFSHSEGGLYVVSIFFMWLLLTNRFTQFIFWTITFSLLLLRYDIIISRFLGYLIQIQNNIRTDLTTIGIIERILLWINPVVLYYGIKGMEKNKKADNIPLVVYATFSPILFSVFDPQFRPLMVFQIFCTMFCYPYCKNKWFRIFFLIFQTGVFILYFTGSIAAYALGP